MMVSSSLYSCICVFSSKKCQYGCKGRTIKLCSLHIVIGALSVTWGLLLFFPSGKLHPGQPIFFTAITLIVLGICIAILAVVALLLAKSSRHKERRTVIYFAITLTTTLSLAILGCVIATEIILLKQRSVLPFSCVNVGAYVWQMSKCTSGNVRYVNCLLYEQARDVMSTLASL
ncbi:hypothetical protein QR680_004124 [Steinernema hermaphroditum]|uniref:Uncharacterized protein n=1 Tax=Steinernema hermaphroditum TaxID=289476 RepID=A0AA39LTG9_9BILA|nr:hypothetical protein QR680_004124 [Steinernema hermaphroditum]